MACQDQAYRLTACALECQLYVLCFPEGAPATVAGSLFGCGGAAGATEYAAVST